MCDRLKMVQTGVFGMLIDVTKQIEGHTICAFGEGSAWPVQGLLRHFKKKIADKINQSDKIKEFTNIDGVVCLKHSSGCGMNADGCY